MPYKDSIEQPVDWWTENAPSGGGVTTEQVAQAYREFLGREPEPGLAEQWANGLGAQQGLEAVRSAIASSPEAQAYKSRSSATATSGGGLPASGRTMDDAAIGQQVAHWAAMPGADPSLASDPAYWIRRIKETGGLGNDNTQYWQDAGVGPTAFFRNPGRESGGNASYGPRAGFGAAPATYVAPQWQGGDFVQPVKPNELQTPFKAPTLEELKASPGYQARLDAGLQAADRAAAAQGTVLSGGTQKARARYAQDYASNEYGNLFAQSAGVRGINTSEYNTGVADAYRNYTTRYGQFMDAAALGKNAFDTNVLNKRNSEQDYWSRLNDLFQTGASTANASYRPGGFA